jgi:hypothetical protein
VTVQIRDIFDMLFTIYCWVFGILDALCGVSAIFIAIIYDRYTGLLVAIATMGGAMTLASAVGTEWIMSRGDFHWNLCQISIALSCIGGSISAFSNMTPYKMTIIITGTSFIACAAQILVLLTIKYIRDLKSTCCRVNTLAEEDIIVES